MLSKFSVKKPYTVLVGIILVIVLGIVSLMKSTTDLFPSMELPYVIVITTYPGASPESVENYVTKPIEQSVATVNNAKEINSNSYENYSMVAIEFNGDANMDSATIDMREKLDQITGMFPDEVSNPIIMKINPDMMPVMVTALDMDGKDSVELSEYVENEIIPEIEAVDGVASVDSVGMVQESVQVVLNEDKIADVNKKVKAALDEKFEDAEGELDNASAQIQSGKNAISSGKQQLENQLGPVQDQLEDGQSQLAGLSDTLTAQYKQLDDSLTELKKLPAQRTALAASLEAVQKAYDTYNTCKEGAAALEPFISSGTATAEQQAQYTELTATMTAIESQLVDANGNPVAIADVPALITTMTEGLAQMDAVLANYDASVAALEDGKSQIIAGLAPINTSRITVNEGLSQVNLTEIMANINMITAEVKLDTAADKIESGRAELDNAKDAAYSGADMEQIITSDLIKNILSAQNFSMPAGYIVEDNVDYLVRVGNKFEDLEDMSDFVLMDLGMDGVEPITLADVADVTMVNDADSSYTSINGNAGIMLSITKQTDFATSEVSDELNGKLEDLAKDNDGLHVTNLMDQGIYIDLIVSSVLDNLAFGAILAILILLLFLKDIRPTGIIAFSIPISVIFALVLMYFSGVTLNVISLSGLALGVGMLVDNSIVVIENIYRLRHEGVPVKEAAITGAKQVAGAITASTFTTVCVFAPIVFTTGITKQLFVDMGLTIAYSLFASLIVALTFVPMCAAKMFDKVQEKTSKLFDKLQNVYGKAIEFCLSKKALVIITALVLLVGSLVGAYFRGGSLMPSMDSTQMSLTLTMPEGTTELSDTAAMSEKVIEKINEIEDVDTVGAMVGGNSMMGMGGDTDIATVSMYIICKEDKKTSNQEIADLITEKTKNFDCEIAVSASVMDMSALGASGIVGYVKGNDLDKLQEISKDICKKLEKVEGIDEVNDGLDETTPEYRIVVDKDKAAEYGLTVAQVFQVVYAEIADATEATTLSTDSSDYSVYVEDGKKDELTIKDIKNLEIEGKKNQETTTVKLSKIAEVSAGVGLSTINRNSQTRYIAFSGTIKEGYNVTRVSSEVEDMLKDYDLPSGYSLQFEGENETIMDAMGQVMLMMILAIVLMYLIMVIQFQSFKYPFIIMFTIPLAFTGGLAALLFTGNDISVIALVGMVMLAGIIVNNGIVLVDMINQLMEGGLSKHEAIVTAGMNRLRPIIMTALTTILGLSTMALGLGMGSDMAQPMAIVTIGGLIYGTLLTLLLVPCIYDIFNRKDKKKKVKAKELDEVENQEEV